MRHIKASQYDPSNQSALRQTQQPGRGGRPKTRPLNTQPVPPFQVPHRHSHRSLDTRLQCEIPASLRPAHSSNSAPQDPLRGTQATYAALAATYDASNDGWHILHAETFITRLSPPLATGSAVLDLACGTGLVTHAAAEAVGPDGVVVGVDVAEEMLNMARRKVDGHGQSGTGPGTGGSDDNSGGDGQASNRPRRKRAPITWIQADIAGDLLSEGGAIRDVVCQRGGFDLITCCSAFILLEDRRQCLTRWTRLLKPGGRIVLDVPTEDISLARLWFHDLRLAVGARSVLDVGWVRGLGSLEEVVQRAGLRVQKSWRTRSWVPETSLRQEERNDIFERNVARDKAFADRWGLKRLRTEWERIWDEAVGEDGRLRNGYALYVVVGKKPAN